MQANGRAWRIAAVIHRLRSPSAREEDDFSLPGLANGPIPAPAIDRIR
jgi:hypothetical protein